MSGNFAEDENLQSPLLNHLILQRVFKNLKFPDRKSCRQVCSLWNYVIFQKGFGHNAILSLNDSNFERYLKFLGNHDLNSNSQFENLDVKINSAMSLELERLDPFWDVLGEHMKHLRLEVTTRYAKFKLRDILLTRLKCLESVKIIVTKFWGSESEGIRNEMPEESSEIPVGNRNLKRLSYSYLGSMGNHGVEMTQQEEAEFIFPIDWIEGFQKFPNLQELSLVGMSEYEINGLVQAMELQGSKLKIKSLELLDENMCPEAPTNDQISLLSSLPTLRLESLHLEISFFLNTEILNEFLLNQASTLRSLHLRRFPLPYLSTPVTLKLSLGNLTLLEISDGLVNSLGFLDYLPKLKTLNVILRDYRNLPTTSILQNTSENQRSHQNLENVYIEPPLMSPACVTKLLKLARNLKKLTIRVDNEMLQALCETGNGLEELHLISWGGLTDEGFTGIPQALLGNPGRMDNLEEFRTLPYIGNLQTLRKLRVEMWREYSNSVSDASVYFGFVDLKNLKEFLGIRTEINEYALRQMRPTKCTLQE